MSTFFWFVVIVACLLLYAAVWGVIGSHIAGIRDQDRVEGFKTGLFLGPIGAAVVLYRKEPLPDIEVDCPHCGTRQDVGARLEWFECWKCEERTNL